MTYTQEELSTMVLQMREVSSNFYCSATRINNHAFIEFCGLMNEYIKICEQSLAQGVDFTECNIHCGKPLVIKSFNADYVKEKLECIYSTSLDINVSLPKEGDDAQT